MSKIEKHEHIETNQEVSKMVTEQSEKSTENVQNAEVQAKKPTKEELKAQIRRGNTANRGRLFIDPKYKRPGKSLRIVTLKPGRKEYLESIGYTHRPDIDVNGGSLAQPKAIGGQFEAGINVSTPSIVMEIDTDLLAAREEVKCEDNESVFKNKVKANQRKDQQ